MPMRARKSSVTIDDGRILPQSLGGLIFASSSNGLISAGLVTDGCTLS